MEKLRESIHTVHSGNVSVATACRLGQTAFVGVSHVLWDS